MWRIIIMRMRLYHLIMTSSVMLLRVRVDSLNSLFSYLVSWGGVLCMRAAVPCEQTALLYCSNFWLVREIPVKKHTCMNTYYYKCDIDVRITVWIRSLLSAHFSDSENLCFPNSSVGWSSTHHPHLLRVERFKGEQYLATPPDRIPSSGVVNKSV